MSRRITRGRSRSTHPTDSVVPAADTISEDQNGFESSTADDSTTTTTTRTESSSMWQLNQWFSPSREARSRSRPTTGSVQPLLQSSSPMKPIVFDHPSPEDVLSPQHRHARRLSNSLVPPTPEQEDAHSDANVYMVDCCDSHEVRMPDGSIVFRSPSGHSHTHPHTRNIERTYSPIPTRPTPSYTYNGPTITSTFTFFAVIVSSLISFVTHVVSSIFNFFYQIVTGFFSLLQQIGSGFFSLLQQIGSGFGTFLKQIADPIISRSYLIWYLLLTALMVAYVAPWALKQIVDNRPPPCPAAGGNTLSPDSNTPCSEQLASIMAQLAASEKRITEAAEVAASAAASAKDACKTATEANQAAIDASKVAYAAADAIKALPTPSSAAGVDVSSIRSEIEIALEKYSADRTELVDYALKSSGGRIIHSSSTHEVPLETDQNNWFSFISKKKCILAVNKPDEILSDTMSVGSCWPMAGSNGHVSIGLRERIVPSHVSLQHISTKISPDYSPTPKVFTVWGVQLSDYEQIKKHSNQAPIGTKLGTFTYLSNSTQLQTFELTPSPSAFSIVTIGFESNYGNPSYTCIYRVRVHGNRTQDDAPAQPLTPPTPINPTPTPSPTPIPTPTRPAPAAPKQP